MLKKLLSLFVAFMKIGLFTIGGGYAMLPMIQREIVENRKWATDQQITDIYAIGQCTPGVIAVNTATYIGYTQAGVLGGIFATFGLIAAPLAIIMVIAAFLQNFAEYRVVKDAFAGIRVCVVVLILNATIKLWKNSINGIFSIIIFAVVLGCSLFTELSSIIFVLVAAAAGVALALIQGRRKKS